MRLFVSRCRTALMRIRVMDGDMVGVNRGCCGGGCLNLMSRSFGELGECDWRVGLRGDFSSRTQAALEYGKQFAIASGVVSERKETSFDTTQYVTNTYITEPSHKRHAMLLSPIDEQTTPYPSWYQILVCNHQYIFSKARLGCPGTVPSLSISISTFSPCFVLPSNAPPAPTVNSTIQISPIPALF